MSTPARLEPEAKVPPLPHLRGELCFEVVAEVNDRPAVVVTDPVRGCYFRLGWPESVILLHWHEAATVPALQALLNATYGLRPEPEAIASVAEFAFANQLTTTDQKGSWNGYSARVAAGKKGLLQTLMHGYLFFRLPLLRPDRSLKAMLPMLSCVFARPFWLGLAALALLGIYLATRQWAAVVTALHNAWQLEGLVVFAGALFGLKAIHELGHALTAAHYGCRVPSMGIAIMFGVPVLYTDTSDRWRLPRRGQRLAIVFAGVAAEMIVATFAILAWALLADGLLRDICFALATTSIVLSLAVNLNPFMRFDGYYALSDYWGMPNLQTRAFKLSAWWWREVLFDIRHPAPEQFNWFVQARIIAYGLCTIVYRLFLYLGILLLVYTMAGKAIGIILAVFEIMVLIGNPITRELKVWWHMRAEILQRQRLIWPIAILAMVSIALFVPWLRVVEAPAVLVSAREVPIHLPFAAELNRIVVTDGQQVQAGDVLFEARSDDLVQRQRLAELEVRSLEFQVARLHADIVVSADSFVVKRRLARAREELEAVAKQQAQLVVRAAFAGRIVDVDPELSVPLWLNSSRPLARLVATDQAAVKGLISDTEIGRIAAGATATFIPDDPLAPHRQLTVMTIASASDGGIAEPALAQHHGGTVAAGENGGKLKALHGWFEVTLASVDRAPASLMRGIARVEAEPVSPAARLWRQLARVLMREQSF